MHLTAVRCALLLILSPAAIAPARVDGQASPYSQLRVRLSGARNVNRERLHDYWRAGTGAGVGVTTPFYVGSVGATATVIPFRTREVGRPNFTALMLGVDWGVELPVPGPVHARAAARVGDFVMLFENPDLWLDSESELFVGAELSAGWQMRRDLAVTAAGTFAHVQTRPSLGLALLSVGLEYATRTPGWLRAILE
jgi:hypothetical protein